MSTRSFTKHGSRMPSIGPRQHGTDTRQVQSWNNGETVLEVEKTSEAITFTIVHYDPNFDELMRSSPWTLAAKAKHHMRIETHNRTDYWVIHGTENVELHIDFSGDAKFLLGIVEPMKDNSRFHVPEFVVANTEPEKYLYNLLLLVKQHLEKGHSYKCHDEIFRLYDIIGLLPDYEQ